MASRKSCKIVLFNIPSCKIVLVHIQSSPECSAWIDLKHFQIGLKYTAEHIWWGAADISGFQGLDDELPQDVQKKEFLGLDAKLEFTTHFNFFHYCLSFLRRRSLRDVTTASAMLKQIRGKWFRGWQRQPELDDAGLMMKAYHACRVINTVRPMHVMHASAPAHQRPPLGAPVHLAVAAGELAPMRTWHAWSQHSWWHAFSKPACTSSGCRCRPRKYFPRSFFGIVTKRERRKNILKMPEIGKTRRGWQGLIPGPSQWKLYSRTVLYSNVLI